MTATWLTAPYRLPLGCVLVASWLVLGGQRFLSLCSAACLRAPKFILLLILLCNCPGPMSATFATWGHMLVCVEGWVCDCLDLAVCMRVCGLVLARTCGCVYLCFALSVRGNAFAGAPGYAFACAFA